MCSEREELVEEFSIVPGIVSYWCSKERRDVTQATDGNHTWAPDHWTESTHNRSRQEASGGAAAAGGTTISGAPSGRLRYLSLPPRIFFRLPAQNGIPAEVDPCYIGVYLEEPGTERPWRAKKPFPSGERRDWAIP
ncbi:hypothetical protein FOZ62_005962, partial [Perkinsus olseni]